MNSHTTHRPRIGLIITNSGRQSTAVELLDKDGNLIGYATQVDGAPVWYPHDNFTPCPDGMVPEPRMDEPGVWGTVVAGHPDWTLRVFFRAPDGYWYRWHAHGRGRAGRIPHGWDDLIDPRPTTPAERETGIVDGEDQ